MKTRFIGYTRRALRECPFPTLTIEEWAGFNGIGRTLAYQLARNDEIPGLLHLGHKLLISTAATQKALGEHE